MTRGRLLADAWELADLHGLSLRGTNVYCLRCGPPYRWPCSRFERAREVILGVDVIAVSPYPHT